MGEDNEASKDEQSGRELEQVSKLADTYARHRTAGPFFVWSVAVVALYVVNRVAMHFARPHVRGHDWAILVLVFGSMAVWLAVTVFFCVDRWGGKLLKRWGARLFEQDGEVRERPRRSLIPKWLFVMGAVVFGVCVGGSVIVGVRYDLPHKYMQPISAIYAVPFMVFLGFWRRTPVTSPLMGLWPVLYVAHAIGVLTDAPVFVSIDGGTHMFIATFGYGALIGLLAYLHSRRTLRKLKRLTRLDGPDGQRVTDCEETTEP